MFKKKHKFYILNLFENIAIYISYINMDDLTHCQICFEKYDHNERIPKMLVACKYFKPICLSLSYFNFKIKVNIHFVNCVFAACTNQKTTSSNVLFVAERLMFD
jgi:hypothetical protein